MKLLRITLFLQTIYYLVTALWPLVHIQSFIEITGPKTDIWLVKTVAVLLLAMSIAFITALWYKKYDHPVISLAVSCCVVLIIIDCHYVLNNTISNVYLLDALAEIFLLILWIIIFFNRDKRK
jgi:hypothetical protein